MDGNQEMTKQVAFAILCKIGCYPPLPGSGKVVVATVIMNASCRASEQDEKAIGDVTAAIETIFGGMYFDLVTGEVTGADPISEMGREAHEAERRSRL